MWVGRIRRCLRLSSTCEGWCSGLSGGIAKWYSACLCGFVRFLDWLFLAVGLFWLVEGFLVCLCGGFALLFDGLVGVCLF